MACSDFVDVQINRADFASDRFVKRIQQKAPERCLGHGMLLRFLRVVSHLDALVDESARRSIAGSSRSGDLQATGIVLIVDGVREIAHIDGVGGSSPSVHNYCADRLDRCLSRRPARGLSVQLNGGPDLPGDPDREGCNGTENKEDDSCGRSHGWNTTLILRRPRFQRILCADLPCPPAPSL